MKITSLLSLALFATLQTVQGLDDVQIQRFIDEAVKAGGGEVVIPPGVHVLERPLVLKNARKLRIIGLDAEESVLKAGPGAAALLLLGGGCEETRIEKLTFEGGQEAVSELEEGGAAAGRLTKMHLGRCFFQNQQRHAVLLRGAEIGSFEIEGCTFRDIDGTAVLMGEGASGCAITHNHVTRCQTGVHLAGSRRCLVASNEISGCRVGVRISAPGGGAAAAEQGSIIALNAIERSLDAAVVIGSHTQGCSVMQNEILDSKGDGIRLAGEKHAVRANKISGSGGKNIAVKEGGHEIKE